MDGQIATPASTTIKWIRRVILGLAMFLALALIAIVINESRNEVAIMVTGSEQLQIEIRLRGDQELNLLPNASIIHEGIHRVSFPMCRGRQLDVRFTSANSQGSMSAGFSGSWGNRVDITLDRDTRDGTVTNVDSTQMNLRTSSLRSWYDTNRNWIPIRSFLD